MRTNAYQSYFENEILSADPVKLVQLLYRGALDAIGGARQYLAAGDIQARSQALTKALNILTELIQTLDHARGGELSQNLLRVYDYAQRLLIDANARQADGPLAEAQGLLATLQEAWKSATTVEQSPEPMRMAATANRPQAYQQAAVYEPLSCAC